MLTSANSRNNYTSSGHGYKAHVRSVLGVLMDDDMLRE